MSAQALAVCSGDDHCGVRVAVSLLQCADQFADSGIIRSDAGIVGCARGTHIAYMHPQKKWSLPLLVVIQPCRGPCDCLVGAALRYGGTSSTRNHGRKPG